MAVVRVGIGTTVKKVRLGLGKVHKVVGSRGKVRRVRLSPGKAKMAPRRDGTALARREGLRLADLGAPACRISRARPDLGADLRCHSGARRKVRRGQWDLGQRQREVSLRGPGPGPGGPRLSRIGRAQRIPNQILGSDLRLGAQKIRLTQSGRRRRARKVRRGERLIQKVGKCLRLADRRRGSQRAAIRFRLDPGKRGWVATWPKEVSRDPERISTDRVQPAPGIGVGMMANFGPGQRWVATWPRAVSRDS